MITRGIILLGCIAAFLDAGLSGLAFFVAGFLLVMLVIGTIHRAWYR